MAYKIAGGTKWWQVRAGPGVEGEWIVLKKDWKDYQKKEKEKEKEKGAEGPNPQQESKREGMVGEDGGVDESGHCELASCAAGFRQSLAERSVRKEMDDLRCMLYSMSSYSDKGEEVRADD